MCQEVELIKNTKKERGQYLANLTKHDTEHKIRFTLQQVLSF